MGMPPPAERKHERTIGGFLSRGSLRSEFAFLSFEQFQEIPSFSNDSEWTLMTRPCSTEIEGVDGQEGKSTETRGNKGSTLRRGNVII
jgi:hypothetical protein